MHPLDTADRIPQIKNEFGSGYCNITKCCTVVCPEHIRITGVVVREPGTPPFRGGRGRPTEVEATEAAPEATPEATTDGHGPPPSPDSPETVAEAPSAQSVRETPATGPAAQEA